MKYGEFHCHSIYSNRGLFTESLSTPAQILKAARSKGLSAIAITDHNTINGNLAAAKIAESYGITVIPGMEINTKEGTHILAYGGNLENIKLSESAEVIINQIHENGGIAIVAHPFMNIFSVAGSAKNLDKLTLLADGLEVFNSHPLTNNSKTASYIKTHKPRIMTGGSDAHHHTLVGNVVLGFPDTCSTVNDFLLALKKGDFVLIKRASRIRAVSLAVVMFIYTQVCCFLRWFKQ